MHQDEIRMTAINLMFKANMSDSFTNASLPGSSDIVFLLNGAARTELI